MKCPTCGSPNPKLHPAMQFEGEVQICDDAFHSGLDEGLLKTGLINVYEQRLQRPISLEAAASRLDRESRIVTDATNPYRGESRSGVMTRMPVIKACRAQLPREHAPSVAGPTLTRADTGVARGMSSHYSESATPGVGCSPAGGWRAQL